MQTKTSMSLGVTLAVLVGACSKSPPPAAIDATTSAIEVNGTGQQTSPTARPASGYATGTANPSEDVGIDVGTAVAAAKAGRSAAVTPRRDSFVVDARNSSGGNNLPIAHDGATVGGSNTDRKGPFPGVESVRRAPRSIDKVPVQPDMRSALERKQ